MAITDTDRVDVLPGFGGQLIQPDHPDYDQARKVWNGMIDRRPLLIARCHGAADVAAAVRFAHKNQLLAAIRGGGHNVAGSAVCDGGLVIDLSPMRRISVDAVARTARAEAGVLWGEFDRECQRHGLATTAGIVSHTGIAGLTVGGGIGHLMRQYGLTCDNVLSMDVVTADGELIHTSLTAEPDLFWALRGGGGNFGVVTTFEYRLHRVGPEVLAGLILHRAERAAEVLRMYRDFVAEAPRQFGSTVSLRTAPSLPWVPEELRGRPVIALAVCYVGPIADGERLLQRIRRFGPPAADFIRPQPYLDHQAVFDATVPHGLHYYWKTVSLPSLTDTAVETLVAMAWRKRSPGSYMILFHKGGAVRDSSDDAMAYSGRDAEHELNIHGAWTAHDGQHADIDWVQEAFEQMSLHSTGGAYINFLGDEGQERVRAAYGPNKYQWLVQLKRRYDPENFFRLNQNISPSD